MARINSFPKIFHIGDNFIPDLFKGDQIEITEKCDGSQFNFGISEDGVLVARSKGKELVLDNPEKMFTLAVNFIIKNEETIRKVLPPGSFIYGEFLGSPSHNILKYSRVPKNHIIVFGALIQRRWVSDHSDLTKLAESLDLEVVPLVYKGPVEDYEKLATLFEVESILGVEKIEGVVIKNYQWPAFLGSLVIPSFGKFVRQEFKERHAKDWGPKFSHGDKMALYMESFRTEARWMKAIQHLRDSGELQGSPKDIGALLKELEKDFIEEEKENVKAKLWELNKEDFLRKIRAGFPEAYKNYLAHKSFDVVQTEGDIIANVPVEVKSEP